MRNMMAMRLFLAALVLLTACAAAGTAMAGTDLLGDRLDGSIGMNYRYRTTANESDKDLYTDFQMKYAFDKDISASLFLSQITDMDSNESLNGFYVFDEILSKKSETKLYTAFVDFKNQLGLADIKVGRQYSYESKSYHFDGIRAESKEYAQAMNLKAYAYAGRPVRYFVSPHENRGVCSSCHGSTGLTDFEGSGSLWGLGLSVRPDNDTRLTLDHSLVTEDAYFGSVDADYTTFSAWHKFSDNFNARLNWNMIESHSSDIRLMFGYDLPDSQFNVQFTYFQQMKTLSGLPSEFDPYSFSMKKYYPYHNFSLTAYKGIGEYAFINGGMDLRKMRDSGAESDFNREYFRLYISPGIRDLPVKGFSASLDMDLWNANGDDVFALGIGLQYKPDNKLKVSAGTSFSKFKYEYFDDTEKTNVRTIYLKGAYKFIDDVRAELGYQLESAEGDTFKNINLGFVVEY